MNAGSYSYPFEIKSKRIENTYNYSCDKVDNKFRIAKIKPYYQLKAKLRYGRYTQDVYEMPLIIDYFIPNYVQKEEVIRLTHEDSKYWKPRDGEFEIVTILEKHPVNYDDKLSIIVHVDISKFTSYLANIKITLYRWSELMGNYSKISHIIDEKLTQVNLGRFEQGEVRDEPVEFDLREALASKYNQQLSL